jgi:outer membrane protein OmpA-like peptidoglycan-associated protein
MPAPRSLLLTSLCSLPLLALPSAAHAGPAAEGKVELSTKKGGKASGKAKADRKKKNDEEKAAEKEKPWIRRWAPENNELDLGVYGGLFIRAGNHGLFDQGIDSQPFVNQTNADIGGRATYFPIRFVGIGIEGGGMPTRAPQRDVNATFWTFRGHVVGQLPFRVTPTLVVGGGILGIRSSDPLLQAGEGVFHWGPGVKAHINKWIALRLDGRHIVEGGGSNGERAHHGEVLLGLDVTLRFRRLLKGKGGKRRSDTDGDGITDFYDVCPDEPGDGDDGCPTKEKDRDGDGIPDSRDRCPSEWSDNPGGCPIPDDDGDGILNSDDACPDEAENYNKFKDKDGCPDERPAEIEEFNGVIKGINFASGKATIRRDSYKVLKKAIRVLNKYPELRIEVSGHTDTVGSHDSNVDLSKRRAEAVKQYLVDSGIDSARIETQGFGPDKPIADNETKAGRAENRRIEFKLLDAE